MTALPAARLLPSLRRPRWPVGRDPAHAVVLAGWVVLAAWLFAFVFKYGSNAPLADEWVLLPPLVGEAPVWPWLWEPHGEHRFVLPRLLWVVVHQLSGHDFRAAMVLAAAAASAAALGLIVVARRLRSRSHAADLLVPALLLHTGHWENWLIGYQSAYVLVTALVGATLTALIGRPAGPAARAVLAAGGAVALLPLCCGAGVLFAGPLAGWVGFAAFQRVRGGRRRDLGLFILPAVTLGMIAVYLATRPPGTIPPGTPAQQVRAAVEALAAGLRPAANAAWPVSGAGVLAAYLVAAAGLVWVVVRRCGTDRMAALGLLAVLAGSVAVAGAIGASRGGMFPGVGFSPRYATFSAAGLVAIYLAAVRFGPARAGRLGGVAAVLTAVVVVACAARESGPYGEVYRGAARAMRADAAAGASDEELAARYAGILFSGPGSHSWMVEGVGVCRRHRIGPFR